MAKRERLRTYIVFVLVVIVFGASCFFYYSHVKEKKLALKMRMDYYNNVIKREQKWLAGLQQSNGAIAFRGKENGTVSVIPYFSSITAAALLQKNPDSEYTDVVTDYFEWYFDHLNDSESDKYGFAGTIYDYRAEVLNGVVTLEKTEQEYDSVDSYAAWFLIALWEYYKQTGDKEYIIAHYRQITDVIGALNATVDSDGLYFTKPDRQVKYLMDNAEVYQGLSCAINFLEQVFLPYYNKGTSEYSEVRQTLSHLQEVKSRQEQAFEKKFWNEAEQRYEVGIDDAGAVLSFSGWTDFYPDAVAQLFPIIFGMLEPESDRSHRLYNKFGEYFDWENMAHYEQGSAGFYWGLTAYCGTLMRDEEKVRLYLNYYTNKVAPEYEYPVYNADVAWVVLAAAEMAGYYRELMQRVDPLGIVELE